MAQETYTHALKVQIGRVRASAKIDDYFPLVGHPIAITATVKWGKSSEWQLQDGSGETISQSGALAIGKDATVVQITAEGELKQLFIARNPFSETIVQKTVYAMRPQSLPYFDFSVTKEVIRADGEACGILVSPQNGYNGTHTIEGRVYRENEKDNPVRTLTFDSALPVSEGRVDNLSFDTPTDRGIYDVEIDVKDTTSGVTFSKRINKLITVTPRLAPEPPERTSGYRDIFATKAYTTYSGKDKVNFFIRLWENTAPGLHYAELTLPAGEQNGTCYYDDIDISVLPSGTTLVLKDDPDEPNVGYARRLLLKGNSPTTVSNENGTPNFSWEKPLIITINQKTPYHIAFQHYNGINFANNCRNIILDGRGYHNISLGIDIHKYAAGVFGESCIFLVNGTSDIELVELNLHDCDFTAIMAKTDPDPNRPWYWFGNWALNKLLLHHSYLHDTNGEGFYIGYFTPENKTGTNSQGEVVTYRGHDVSNARIYRLKFENNGYDAVQLSNARNAEICYNSIYNSAWRGDKDQMSGMSIQSMSGKCYNNVIRKFQGPAMQIGPLGDLEVFNNIATDCPEGGVGIMFLFSVDTPEQNPTGTGIEDQMKVNIHNNVIMCNGVAVNGRNTTQVKGIYCTDNIFVYKTSKFGNMTAETLAQWEAQASGNTWIKQGVIDFVAIDAYKIADSANGNFRLAADSPLIQSGTGGKFEFDFRGYKNWFGTVSPAGAYMGVYKSAAINDEPIVLTSVTIDDGAAVTKLQKVSVKLVYTGAATRYRIGETADLTAAPWADIPAGGVLDYALTDGYGIKTIYVQVGAGSMASAVVSDTIDYQSIPLVLEGITLNNGVAISRHLTVPALFTYSGSFLPVKYRLGEVADLSGVAWLNMTEAITYTFANLGQKTLYGQLQDANENVTEIKSAGISLENLARKTIVSLGWNNSEIPSQVDGLSIFDGKTGITRFGSQQTITILRKIYDTTGEFFGTAVPSSISVFMFTHESSKGKTTDDNSGIYPDVYLAHNSARGGNSVGNESITFAIPAGTYKVRMLCNTIWNVRPIPNDALSYKVETVADAAVVTLPTTGVKDNTANLTEAVTVTVGESGWLRVGFGISGAGMYYLAPLNIIEIEEV